MPLSIENIYNVSFQAQGAKEKHQECALDHQPFVTESPSFPDESTQTPKTNAHASFQFSL